MWQLEGGEVINILAEGEAGQYIKVNQKTGVVTVNDLTVNDLTVTGTLTASIVTSVSNSDGTITISPTSGAVIASLNTAHQNTWTGEQIFEGVTISKFYTCTLYATSGQPYWVSEVSSNSAGWTFTTSFSGSAMWWVDGGVVVFGINGDTTQTRVAGKIVTKNNVLDDGSGNVVLSGTISSTGVKTTAGASTTVSVGASPYTYTNSSVSNQQVFVQGGTVTAISFNPNGVSGISLSGLTDNVITMRPNDTLTITYTSAPTVTTIQL